MVTSPDIENQQNCLMFDAVSAHTDCLIQIVKERRNSSLLREWNSTQPLSRVKPYFQRLFEAPTGLFALPLALSMEAHYRELNLSGKGKLHVFLIKPHNRSNNKQHE
ncbi:hypothetical protein [Aeromonas veronii]|uniref:hypothetical protein n=1 Tax=Aeromonas veronii TaxID=654 RepID=UPI0030074198